MRDSTNTMKHFPRVAPWVRGSTRNCAETLRTARKHLELRGTIGEDDEAFCRAWHRGMRGGTYMTDTIRRVAACKRYGYVMGCTKERPIMECGSIERGSVMRGSRCAEPYAWQHTPRKIRENKGCGRIDSARHHGKQ